MRNLSNKSNRRPNQLIWILCLAILPVLGACQKERLNEDDSLKCPVTPAQGADDRVIGKWKLVKVLPFDGKRQDYSCEHAIYHSKEDGTLTVSGVREGMISRGNGEYILEVTDAASTVRIANSNYHCSIQKNEMILSLAYGLTDWSYAVFYSD